MEPVCRGGLTVSYGHLSFDRYEEDQALSLDAEQYDARKGTSPHSPLDRTGIDSTCSGEHVGGVEI